MGAIYEPAANSWAMILRQPTVGSGALETLHMPFWPTAATIISAKPHTSPA